MHEQLYAPIGYEPKARPDKEDKAVSAFHNKVPNDLIQVLTPLASHKPSDRNLMKSQLLQMLKATGATFLLVNTHHLQEVKLRLPQPHRSEGGPNFQNRQNAAYHGTDPRYEMGGRQFTFAGTPLPRTPHDMSMGNPTRAQALHTQAHS